MESRKCLLGSEYPDILEIMNNLVRTYPDQGRSKEAEETQTERFELFSGFRGPEPPDSSSAWITGIHLHEAESLQAELIELCPSSFGRALGENTLLRRKVCPTWYQPTRSRSDGRKHWTGVFV
jgi:hypothetical protein